MNRWLAEESKWAREQGIKARTRISELSDPAWRSRRLMVLEAEEVLLMAAIDRHLANRQERVLLEDPDALRDHLAYMTREAESWENLAAEQSARLEQTEAEQDSLIP